MEVIISIQHQEDTSMKVTLEMPDGSVISEVLDSICGLLVAYGFSPENVEGAILEKAEEYEVLQDSDES